MNKVEAWKAEKHGFDVWSDLEAYARAGTARSEIPDGDLERMKWYGIFHQGGDDDRYMVRVRVPGCELTARQARGVAGIGRLGDGLIAVTTRGDLEVQGLSIAELPGALCRLGSVGLSTKQTGLDNVRNVMTHPWAGLDPSELLDVRPFCRRMTDVFLDDRLLADLPSEFTIAVDGRPNPGPPCWSQDMSLVAGRRADGSIAFRWLLGGVRRPSPVLAREMPVWVRPDQAVEVLFHTLHAFRAEGSRETRERACLRDLIDRVGEIGFLHRVESRLGHALDRSPDRIVKVRERENFHGWFRQKQEGLWALGVILPSGRLVHEQLDGLADLAETAGDRTLRTGYDRSMVIPNIPTRQKSGAVRALGGLDLEHEANFLTRGAIVVA